jgi:DNA-binding MarR family transcriptional regulator
VTRQRDLDQLYEGLAIFSRRSRELSEELHPGLSLVAYSLLTFVEAHEDTRATDIAAMYGLDKSTVSRQLDVLFTAGLLARTGERTGRRGQVLALTEPGQRALDDAARSVRALLVERLRDWPDGDVAEFSRLVERFNQRDRSASAPGLR